jgi:hypothetical protein
VKTANWSTDRPSKKLSEQIAGPWKVLAKEGHSYRVELPALIKINPVFLAESLCCNLNNLLPSQANASLPPIKVTADDKYKVQEICGQRLLGGFNIIGYYNPVCVNSPFKGLFMPPRCLYK